MTLDMSAIKLRSALGRVTGRMPLWSDVDALAAEVERLQAITTSDQADYAACYEDVRRLCRVLGLFDGARPVSAHAVFDECLAEIERLQVLVARLGVERDLLQRAAEGRSYYGPMEKT